MIIRYIERSSMKRPNVPIAVSEEVNKMFSRNRLVVSDEAQAKIAAANVAVVGIGGIGSVVTEQLVRLGVQNITIAARGTYEYGNVNRQIPATFISIKAQTPKICAMAERVYSINPSVELATLCVDVASSKRTLCCALEENGVRYVFNCVDEYVAQGVTANVAREIGAHMFVAGVVGIGRCGIVTTVHSESDVYEEFFCVKDDTFAISGKGDSETVDLRIKRGWLKRYANQLDAATRELYEKDITTPYPVVTPVPWGLASLAVYEFVKIMCGANEIVVPTAIYVDMEKSCMKTVNVRNMDKWSFVPWRP